MAAVIQIRLPIESIPMKPLRLFFLAVFFCGHSFGAPDAESPVMLSGPWVPENTHEIDFASLPKVPSEHVVISDVRAKTNDPSKLDKKAGGVNQHNYLVHHDGQFWAMWSDGPGIEDRVGQRVKFATSPDGLKWSEPKFMTPIVEKIAPFFPSAGAYSSKQQSAPKP